jgi:hypothetical protein
MALSAESIQPIAALRATLRAMPDVEEVWIDESGIWLVCATVSSAASAPDAARALLRDAGVEAVDAPVRAVVRPESIERERVRFESVERIEEPDIRVRIRIELEWNGARVIGEAAGEKGEAIELRTSALAAIAALDQISGGSLGVRLVGVKQLRAFDVELMVVSLYKPGSGPQKFVGVVQVGSDPRRAAALSVLHALNRVLGNHLSMR